jgi:hypothetical protein
VASSLTVAAFYRLVDEKCPTALMDEFDAWATENVEFRGILNAGFDKRNALKWVCVGDNHTPTAYNLFCPQVLAGIGSVPDTVADRSLKIDLIRKLRSEKVAKLRRRGTAALDELAQKCARWAADNIQDLMTAEPEAPESLNDRAADGWEILFAIANQVGEPWTQRAQIAAIKLSGDEYSIDDESVGAQLLYDIRAVLNENTSVGDKIPSVKLVGWLVDLEDRPWVEFTRESPLTPHKLARLLRKFEIRPGRDGKVRWYDRAKLIAACDRWAPEKPETTASEPIPNGHDSTPPGDSGFASVKASQPEEIRGSHANFKASSESSDDALKTARNPSETAVFDALTLSKPKNGSVAHEESFEPSDQTREQTLDQFRRAGDTGLGIGQMELMDISDDLVDELIAEGLLEELDRNGRRVRLVNKDEVVSNGLDAANDDGDPDADADDDLPVDVLARRLKSKNPSWSIKRIANELGQPESRIARYFAS